MKKLLLTFLLAAYGLMTNAQTYPPKDTPQLESPADSRYGWLNNALFVCAPEWTKEFQGIVLNVWKVK